MAKKFYAVRNGRVPGIYTAWDECRRQVTGFKGAEYKGFEIRADAEAFMSGGGVQRGTRIGAAAAYVDGSFDVKTKRYSYGMIIMYNGKEFTENEAFDDDPLAEMRNVAGEIEGSKAAMLWCIEHDVTELDLFYDYAGIEKYIEVERYKYSDIAEISKVITDKYEYKFKYQGTDVGICLSFPNIQESQ